MLPRLKGLPPTLQRYPRGISEPGFIQQDIGNSAPPDWLGRAMVDRGDGGEVERSPRCPGSADFDSVRDFARQLAEVLVADDPGQRTLAVRKAARDGQVYLDIMRTAYARTAVGPYALRPRPGPRSPPRSGGRSSGPGACGRTGTPCAPSGAVLPAPPIRGRTWPGTPVL